MLGNLPCYKNVPDLIPIRCSALNALAACHYISNDEYREEILETLIAALDKPNSELQKTGFNCIKRFKESYVMEDKQVIILFIYVQRYTFSNIYMCIYTTGLEGPKPTPKNKK